MAVFNFKAVRGGIRTYTRGRLPDPTPTSLSTTPPPSVLQIGAFCSIFTLFTFTFVAAVLSLRKVQIIFYQLWYQAS